MLQRNFATDMKTKQILKKKENMGNLPKNIWTTVNMRQELEAGVKVKTETETKKLVGKVHPPHIWDGKPYK